MDILPVEISELYDAGYDVKLLAFGDKELTQLLNAGMGIGDGITQADAVPEPPDEAVTRRGDIWILGSHRLMYDDSADRNDIEKLMNGSTAQLVNTDPSYNVKVEPRSNNAIAAGLSKGLLANVLAVPNCDTAPARRTLYALGIITVVLSFGLASSINSDMIPAKVLGKSLTLVSSGTFRMTA